MSLRNFEDHKPHNDGPQRRVELDRSRGPVRVSPLGLYDFGEQDAVINAPLRQNVSTANGSPVRTGRLSLYFNLPPSRFAKNGKPPFSSPKTYRPNFTISLAMPIECVSICFAIFPGGVSEPKGNFSTLSAYTFTKYRWGDPGGGHGPPYPGSP
jgi:hypothetical protein